MIPKSLRVAGLLLAVFVVAACAPGVGGLVEMFARDDDGRIQIEWDGRTYSPGPFPGTEEHAVSRDQWGRQIGFAWDAEHRYQYQVFECAGHAASACLVVHYNVIMSTYDAYLADNP